MTIFSLKWKVTARPCNTACTYFLFLFTFNADDCPLVLQRQADLITVPLSLHTDNDATEFFSNVIPDAAQRQASSLTEVRCAISCAFAMVAFQHQARVWHHG